MYRKIQGFEIDKPSERCPICQPSPALDAHPGRLSFAANFARDAAGQ